MGKILSWAKEVFNRTTTLPNNGQVVSRMQRGGVFDRDVNAYLNGVHLRFDVMEFIAKPITYEYY